MPGRKANELNPDRLKLALQGQSYEEITERSHSTCAFGTICAT
jgi:hypothetical protein